MSHGIRETDLLIIGAGPYGLATAALAKAEGIPYQIFGKQMGLWRDHMPRGMILRSDPSWHFDPVGIHTYEKFLNKLGRSCTSETLINRGDFLAYSDWFCDEKGIRPDPRQVSRLCRTEDRFVATLDDGEQVVARRVLVAVGYQYFLNKPTELLAKIPAARVSHTFDWVDFDRLNGKTCLMIGGRQSAYENAALLAEAGVRVHVSHRKAMPAFTQSNWDFVDDLVAATLRDPAWYREATQARRDEVVARFYKEGRLQLEPWLAARVRSSLIECHPETEVVSSEASGARLNVTLSNGRRLEVDHVMLATGYKVDVAGIPFLDGESIVASLRSVEGFPVLSPRAESTVPGLYFAGMTATKDFGLIFGFVKGAPVSANLVIGRSTTGNPR